MYKKIIPWIIPFIILLYIAYYLIIPASGTYILDIGQENDTSGEFYIIENNNLSERQIINDNYFRELNGKTEIVFKPKERLKGREISLSTESENVYVIVPISNLSIENYFENRKKNLKQTVLRSDEGEILFERTQEEIIETITNNRRKNELYVDFSYSFPYIFEIEQIINGTLHKIDEFNQFDGNTRLILKDEFDSKNFTIYIKFTPKENKDNQLILGNSNWKLFQHSNKLNFNDMELNLELNKTQEFLVTYNELYKAEVYTNNDLKKLDNMFISNENSSNLVIGQNFVGDIHKIMIIPEYVNINKTFIADKEILNLKIEGNGIINKIELEIK